MPPLSEPEVVGWLLLFIPGFVFLAVLSYFGPSARGRSQLAWIVYAVLLSLFFEVCARLSVDRFSASGFSATTHPVRRAVVLLIFALIAAGIVVAITHWYDFFSLRWRIFGESVEPRVWTAFFRNPDAQDYVRVELTNGQAFIAHVDLYSADVNDPPRELVLTDLRLERDGEWVPLSGALYVDSGQIRSVLRVSVPSELAAATDVLGAKP